MRHAPGIGFIASLANRNGAALNERFVFFCGTMTDNTIHANDAWIFENLKLEVDLGKTTLKSGVRGANPHCASEAKPLEKANAFTLPVQ